MQNINEIKDQICDVCHKMWQLGWVAANDGNVSVRLEDGRILATPTGMSKSFITPEKLVLLDHEGNVLEAAEGLRPSSEIKMHLRCYDKRDDVMSVIHAHPPGATGFAVAHKAMDMYNMIEDVAVIGAVPLTPYGTPLPFIVWRAWNCGPKSPLTLLSWAAAMTSADKIFKSSLICEAITESPAVTRATNNLTRMTNCCTRKTKE